MRQEHNDVGGTILFFVVQYRGREEAGRLLFLFLLWIFGVRISPGDDSSGIGVGYPSCRAENFILGRLME